MALGADERDAGWILPCVSAPLEDCALDVAAMGLTEEEFLAGDRSATFTVELEDDRALTRDVRAVRLRLVEPETMDFVAGQFVNLEIPGTDETRAYSMANPPSERGAIDLLVKVLPGGRFSGLLGGGLRPGARLRVHGPFGQLRVRLSHRPIVMIAGGTGLAPVLSMVADLAARAEPRPVTLFFGVRTAEDLFCMDRLEALRAAMPGLEVIPALSHAWPEGWGGETGLITDVVARRLPSAAGYDAYVCGPPPCVDAAVPLLIARGARKRNVYFDVFTPAR
jgi:NAD(P)H-flavin reductase